MKGSGVRAPCGGKAHHAGQGIGAVKRAIRLPQNLDRLNTDTGNVGEFHRSSDCVSRNAINQHFVRVGRTSADIQPSGATHLTGLCHLQARYQTERILHLR